MLYVGRGTTSFANRGFASPKKEFEFRSLISDRIDCDILVTTINFHTKPTRDQLYHTSPVAFFGCECLLHAMYFAVRGGKIIGTRNKTKATITISTIQSSSS
jgi:hypothetical protein